MAAVPEGLSPNAKTMIDEMPIDEMHDMWKFAPLGTFTIGEPRSEYFAAVMQEKREADPAGWTAASKSSFRPRP